MSEYYKKVDDHTMDHDGKRYFEKSFVAKRLSNNLETIESLQNRSHEAEKLLMGISNHWFINFFFGKKIKKHLEKYRNIKLKF